MHIHMHYCIRAYVPQLLPQWLGLAPVPDIDTSKPQKPQWDLEHWTPIAITSFSENPKYQMCKLNFRAYSVGGPNKTPMFKDLLAASQCKGNNLKSMRLSEIKKEMEMEESAGKPKSIMIPPTGFVFHESRVGSTLVANLLGTDPFNMVFSESAPPASVLMNCRGCSHQDQVDRFRDTVLAMGRSPTHKRVFFKFQSITATAMKIALEAFPDTPWVFIYRDPVQTMMSHMDPDKGGGRNANCLKSKKKPSEKFKEIMTTSGLDKMSSAPKEAVCAAHLNMLCECALEALEEYGTYDSDPERSRGLLIDYKFLPGAVPTVLLPHFGLTETPAKSLLQSMAKESLQYSKGSSRNSKRGKTGVFTGDSADKERRSSVAIDDWSKKIMGPTYEKMNALSLPVLESLSRGVTLDAISVIPGSENFATASEEESQVTLSTFAYEPFTNTHNSSRYEVDTLPFFC